ncbi:MAG: hypothetical protein CMJ23_09565 [Phycisphaerae bacterium]|nr:hypothetical protein [Phycisphaerae bacterium]
MEILELLLVKAVLLVVFLVVRGNYRTATADVLEAGIRQINAVSTTVEDEPAVTAAGLRPMQPTRAAIFLQRQVAIQFGREHSANVTNEKLSAISVSP